ncbi:hypothetical protein GGR57DRAFT_65391 [Xylariaceae sp. FL1272]|nr:hypothetical protein GGR57DRAFT_65391 [Xylariaceae sp. FL1272]
MFACGSIYRRGVDLLMASAIQTTELCQHSPDRFPLVLNSNRIYTSISQRHGIPSSERPLYYLPSPIRTTRAMSSTTNSSSTYPSSGYSMSSSWASNAAPPYARELDITTSSTTSGNRPLMSYSTTFSSDWQRDYGSSHSSQQTRSWSTTAQGRGNGS